MTTSLSNAIQPQFRTIDGLSTRFAESETRDDHALLLSPWPESIYAFEPTWSRLAEHTHLVAIDLPGFGRSERRDELMSPAPWANSSSTWPTPSASRARTSWDRRRHPGGYTCHFVRD